MENLLDLDSKYILAVPGYEVKLQPEVIIIIIWNISDTDTTNLTDNGLLSCSTAKKKQKTCPLI